MFSKFGYLVRRSRFYPPEVETSFRWFPTGSQFDLFLSYISYRRSFLHFKLLPEIGFFETSYFFIAWIVVDGGWWWMVDGGGWWMVEKKVLRFRSKFVQMKFRLYKCAEFWKICEKLFFTGKKSNFKFQNRGYFRTKNVPQIF